MKLLFLVLYWVASLAFGLYYYILIARCILSFFPMDAPVQNNKIANLIYRVTDPVLIPFQKVIPPINLGGMYIDFSPILIFFIYKFVGGRIINILFIYSH